MSKASLVARHRRAFLFQVTCIAVTWTGVILLAILIFHVTRQGVDWLDWQFLTSFPSRFPEKAGIQSALWGTVWLISLTACFSIPVGLASAIYLEEFAGDRCSLYCLWSVGLSTFCARYWSRQKSCGRWFDDDSSNSSDNYYCWSRSY